MFYYAGVFIRVMITRSLLPGNLDLSSTNVSPLVAPYPAQSVASGYGLDRFSIFAVPVFAFALLCFFQASAMAEVYSITASPAEDSSTQMNIGWHADLDETSCSVVYTQKADGAWAAAKMVAGSAQRTDIFAGIESKSPDGQDWIEDARFLDYGVTLTGLQPDTDYMYKVVAGDSTTTATPRYFKTAGAKEFSFLWISDSHIYTPIPSRAKNMNAAIDAGLNIDPNVSFIFSTGDVVAWGGSYSFWRNLFDQPFVSKYMFANVIGNHDWMKRRDGGNSQFFAVAHNNPTNGYAGQEGVCYWFIYGDVLYITLNNEEMRAGPEAIDEAKAWAAGVIKEQEGRYKHIFLAEHYHWFNGRNGASSWYDNWKDFCDEHKVTLALSGHNHIYQRTHPLRGGEVVPAGQGTVYMVAPSSDGERGAIAGPLIENFDKIAFTYASNEHSNETHVKTIGCVLVEVTPEKIRTRLVYIDENKQVHLADESVF